MIGEVNVISAFILNVFGYFSNQEATSKTGVKIFHELKDAIGSRFGK